MLLYLGGIKYVNRGANAIPGRKMPRKWKVCQGLLSWPEIISALNLARKGNLSAALSVDRARGCFKLEENGLADDDVRGLIYREVGRRKSAE